MLDLLVITFVTALVIHWVQSKPFFWKNSGIPYSIPWPILGSTSAAFFKPLHEVWEDFYWKMGEDGMYGFHLFGTPSLIVGDPELIRRITISDSECFMSHGFHTEVSYDPMSKGIFFVNGEEWKTIRSKMSPYFTQARIKKMLHFLKPIVKTFTQSIIKESKNGPVDMNEFCMKLSVDVIVCSVFGLKPDCFVSPNSFFYNLQRELFSFMTGVKLMIAELSPMMYAFCGLSVFSKNATDKFKSFIKEVILLRLNGKGNRPDFMQGMVDLLKKEQTKCKEKNEFNQDGTPIAKFDVFTITGQCMLMYIAGTETTGNTLWFLLYELAINEEIQAKTRNEICSMIEKTDGKYDFEALQGLKYVNMVLSETLRKYPIVTNFSRRCTKAVTIKGIYIPVGTMIVMPPLAIHRDPRYFPEPEKFIPERFSDSFNIPSSYIPFGSGPRTCIGLKFAQTEIILALCHLLPLVKILPSKLTEDNIKFSANPTLSPIKGIMLDLIELNY